MQLFKADNIRWDCTDDDEPGQNAQALNLPSETYVFAEDEDAVTDVLSDRYGWCIESLHFAEVDHAMVLVAA